ncbi:MAG: alpha/beta fold hydrolase [Crenarchaeota archaeon]|nr:alpha/beta fold hydrolase [Thermoproteota archaeon]MCR8454012.1 alpha/beta fold hydrolase [Thermoproteota archaeon]MCR8463611.1 alpha/beta fold hydrolase [Thermoproteota archaeon]MCR8470449.1 alpha/beta fold hydrolase [Thermoproteota archaeon]MCR8471466.1 alpha/beta fold hydrolase [Thermoproteota archaeon]
MKKSMVGFLILLTMLALLLTLAYSFEYVGVARVSSITIENGGTLIIAAKVWEPVGTRLGTVVLIHGALASKEMLHPLASDLTRAGWRVVLFDQPGHGGTTGGYFISSGELVNTTLALKKVLNQTTEYRKMIIDYLRRETDSNETVIFGGHSLGAFLAILLAVEAQNEFNVLATIAIAPPYFPGLVNSSVPRNLLICLGEHDEFIKFDAVRMYLDPTNSSDIRANRIYGSFENGTARMIFVSKFSDHILEVYDPAIISRVLEWIDNARGISGVRYVNLGTFIAALKAIAGLTGIALVSLIPLPIAEKLGMISGGKRFPIGKHVKVVIIASIIVWPLLTVVLLMSFLSGIVYIAGSIGYIVPILVGGYLFVAIVAIIFSSSVISKSNIKDHFKKVLLSLKSDFYRGTFLGVIEGILYVLLLHLTYGSIAIPVIPQTVGRMIIAIPTAFMIFWYFIFHEYFYRAQIQEILGGRRFSAATLSILISLTSKIVVIVVIIIMMYLIYPVATFTIIIALSMVLIALLTEGLSAASYYATREIYPHALASAIIWASIATAAFPTAWLAVTL